jgi:hypothetical protein
MTTLTPQQVHQTSAYWANKWFAGLSTLPAATAVYSTDDLNAAIQAIDNAFDTTLNAAVSAGHGAQTIVQALNSVIPAPVSGATAQQKAELVSFAIAKRYGLI